MMTPSGPTTITQGNIHLRTEEQDKVFQALNDIRKRAKLSERFFLDYGELIAAGALGFQCLIYWRANFRGLNLSKYAKHRLSTLLLCGASACHATLIHGLLTTSRLGEYFRPENHLYYGLRSLSSHALGSASTFFVTTGVCFCVAQRAGIIPIPDNFIAKGTRTEVIKYMAKKLKPFSRGMITATLVGCSAMFLVGVAEYNDSKNLLAKINRKTVSMREH